MINKRKWYQFLSSFITKRIKNSNQNSKKIIKKYKLLNLQWRNIYIYSIKNIRNSWENSFPTRLANNKGLKIRLMRKLVSGIFPPDNEIHAFTSTGTRSSQEVRVMGDCDANHVPWWWIIKRSEARRSSLGMFRVHG